VGRVQDGATGWPCIVEKCCVYIYRYVVSQSFDMSCVDMRADIANLLID